MSTRIHIVVDEAEKERFRLRANREGKSLSSWLRDAARDKLAAAETRAKIDTLDELRAFFSDCDARESGKEPEWEHHRRVIEGSIRSGAPDA